MRAHLRWLSPSGEMCEAIVAFALATGFVMRMADRGIPVVVVGVEAAE